VKAYLHDLTAWNALSAKEQELVVGRTKLADIELGDDVKPSNSHLAVNTIVDETRAQLPIVLDNMPFGHVGAEEVGTHFIGYAATPAVTGSLFFPPAADFLDNLPPRPSVATSDVQSVDNRSGARV
jgi:putative iron-dependent peroxidase